MPFVCIYLFNAKCGKEGHIADFSSLQERLTHIKIHLEFMDGHLQNNSPVFSIFDRKKLFFTKLVIDY